MAIPELDTYDMREVDQREYAPISFDARRAAEEEIEERCVEGTRQAWQRVSGVCVCFICVLISLCSMTGWLAYDSCSSGISTVGGWTISSTGMAMRTRRRETVVVVTSTRGGRWRRRTSR